MTLGRRQEHVLPRFRRSRTHQIRLPVKLPIRRDIPPSPRVVMQHRNRRRHTRAVGVGCAWVRWRGARLRRIRRLVERTRRWRPGQCLGGRRFRRQGRPLHRTKSPVLDTSPVIRRQSLRPQVRIQRIWPQSVLALRNRHLLHFAVADFHRGSALPGLPVRGQYRAPRMLIGIAFARSVHSCPGGPLARVEGRVVRRSNAPGGSPATSAGAPMWPA